MSSIDHKLYEKKLRDKNYSGVMKREIDQCLSDVIASLPFASQVLEGSDVVAGVDFFQVAWFEKLDCVVDFLGVHPAVRVVETKDVYNGNT